MGKIVQYLLEVKSELSKVVWPTKTQTIRHTGAVIAFSAAIAAVLGAADYGLVLLLEKIINK